MLLSAGDAVDPTTGGLALRMTPGHAKPVAVPPGWVVSHIDGIRNPERAPEDGAPARHSSAPARAPLRVTSRLADHRMSRPSHDDAGGDGTASRP
jgi:hypothetical protein